MAMTTDENSESESESDTEEPPFEKITFDTNYKIKTSLEEPPMDLELKPLPDNLEYAFLEEPSFLLLLSKDAHLVLNWEKCHFMVKEGIMLGHNVSEAGLEVDKAKINIISKLPPPINIKGVRSFLGHAGFYQRFIKDISKIVRPLTKLLEKDTPFEFDDECHNVFKLSKEKLTCAHTIVHSDHSSLRHLFKKQDAKPCLIRRVLLLYEFDIETKDKKGTENIAADHLSRIENDETSDDNEVNDNFPGETLME
ncbi:hypothetical protein Tco_0127051 [Tanacetum coccineum]